jgi:AraC-like DNA-binding protein
MTKRASPLTKHASVAEPGRAQVNSVPANTIRVFLAALEKLGYPVEALLAQTGTRRADLAGPDADIPCAVLPRILDAAMRHRPIKDIGARLAAETPMGAFPLVDYLVVTSETVGTALGQLARYLRLTEAAYTLNPAPDQVPIRVHFDRPVSPFAAEFGVVLTVLHLREEVEGPLDILSVTFSHGLDDSAEIEKIAGCPVYGHAAWNGFELSRDAWEMPMRRRDPILRGVLEQHAAEVAAKMKGTHSLAREIGRVLASRMPEGNVRIESVARALATSTRSLQRRLAEAGLTYQKVLDQTRRDAAGEYLSDQALSTGEVAYLLGYSEPAAFHRAFKRWNGVTPQAFRNRKGMPSVAG